MDVCILLMVQKSGVYQLRLVVEIPLFYKVLAPSKRWLFGISEPINSMVNIYSKDYGTLQWKGEWTCI